MTTSKKKAPAKKTSTAPAAKGKAVVTAKVATSAKRVKAPPQALKTSVPPRKPNVMSSSKLAVVPAEPAKVPAVKKSGKNTSRKTAPVAIDSKVRIFQIYYQDSQRQHLDPAFEAYNNAGDNSPLLELNVFRKLFSSDLTKKAELWGALSWRFTEKTGMTGGELRQFIAANPGHDVYYCNPYPELEAIYHNLWVQGETSHPNFLVLCQEFFEAAGIDVGLTKELVPSNYFAAANYFVATPRFWRAYMEYVANVVLRAEARMSKTAKAMIYSNAADRVGVHAGASYLPFIVERLFSVFLAQNQKTFSACKFPLPAKEEALNVHLKLLRQMKDLSIKSKSLWMATCWVNYRNLYMSNHFGAEWCRKHLKNITPTEFKYLK